MKNILSIIIFCFTAELIAQTTIYEQNFDALVADSTFTPQISTGEWETWDNVPNGNLDPIISSSYFASDSNALKITEGKDVVYYLGNLKNGHYEVEFDFYIPTGKSFYFNLEHTKGWNYLNAFYFQNDSIRIEPGVLNSVNYSIYGGTYSESVWNTLNISLDLDNNWMIVYLNSDSIFAEAIDGSQNYRPLLNMDVINFFGYNSISEYYIDNFKLLAYKEKGNVDLDVPSMLEANNLSSDNIILTNSDVATIKYDANVVFDHHTSFDQGPMVNKSFNHFDSVANTYNNFVTGGISKSFSYFDVNDMDGFLGLTLDSAHLPFLANGPDTIGATYFVVGKPTSTINPLHFDSLNNYSKELNTWNGWLKTFNIGDFVYQGGDFLPGIQSHDYDTFYTYNVENPNTRLITEFGNDGYVIENSLLKLDLYFSGQVWPEWLSITNPIGKIEEGENLDLMLNFDLSLLEINNEYTASIRVKSNDEVNGVQSIPVTLNYNNISVDENDIEVGVLSYPNPTTDGVNLQSNEVMKSIRIYDLNGKEINHLQVNSNDIQVDMSDFSNGQYIYKIRFEKGEIEKSIIKK